MSKKTKHDKFIEELDQKIQNLIEKYKGKIDFDIIKLNEEWEMGIDEAGRGPVLGPMIYGTCYWPKRFAQELADLGFADSKQLTEEQRDELFKGIEKLQGICLSYEVKELTAEYISNKMLAKCNGLNLNQISFESAYYLINSTMQKSFNVTHIYIDTVGSYQTYQNRLENDFRFTYPSLNFTVSEKADSKFPVVSAASICAKVVRDNCIKEFKLFSEEKNQQINKNWGSGYPADPNTKNWLKENFDQVFAFPNIVRYSWQTIDKIIKDQGLQIDFHETDEADKNQPSISDIFGKKEQSYLQRKLQLNFDDVQI